MDNKYLPRVKGMMDNLGEYVDNVEAFNEPDEPNNRLADPSKNQKEYVPGLPAAKFGEALKKTYEAVHGHPKAQDDVKVITGGLDSGQTQYLKDAAAATMKDGQPTLYADGIGLHPYGKDPNGEKGDENALATIVDNYANLDLNTPNGNDLPIYITEASQPKHEDAARFNGDFANAAADMSAVERSYFFWKDTDDGHPGLIRPDGTKTDAYNRLASLTGQQRNA
jgi:hypothetical protein